MIHMTFYWLKCFLPIALLYDVIKVQSDPLELITFWGQNAATNTLGIKEPSLEHLCRQSPYTTIVIGYVSKFFNPEDFEDLPKMDFSSHCKYYTHNRMSCPHMREAIHLCHVNNKKVLIGLGGPKAAMEFTHFETEENAISFAHKMWNLFLGGKEMIEMRPFGNVMLDGINLRMDEQDSDNLRFFIATLDNLRQQRRPTPDKNFLITISPTCVFPTSYFGPEEGKILSDPQIIPMIDQVYVWYTDISCCVKGSRGFVYSHEEWNQLSSEKNLNLYFGISTKTQAADELCYLPPAEQMKVFKTYEQTNINLKGFALIDNSHDIDETLTTHYGFTNALIRAHDSLNIPSFRPHRPPDLPPPPTKPPHPHHLLPGHIHAQQTPIITNPTPITPTMTIPKRPQYTQRPPIGLPESFTTTVTPAFETIASRPPLSPLNQGEDEEFHVVSSQEPKPTPKLVTEIQQTVPDSTPGIAQEAENVEEGDDTDQQTDHLENDDGITTPSPSITIATGAPYPMGDQNVLMDRSCFNKNAANKTVSKNMRKKCFKQLYKKRIGTQKLTNKLKAYKQYDKYSNESFDTKPSHSQTTVLSALEGKHEPFFIPIQNEKKNTTGGNNDKYFVVV